MRKTTQQIAITYALIISLIGGLLVPAFVSAVESESRVLLCTSQGYEWVDISVAQEFQLTDGANTSAHCVFCLSGNDDLESVAFCYQAHALIWQDAGSVDFFDGRSESSHPFYSLARPRAPPLFI